MSRVKASLMFDPNRREEQLAFVRERVSELHEYGSQAWVSITEDQAARFAEQGIWVQFHESSDMILLPAVIFDPSQAVPEPPAELSAQEPRGEDTAYHIVQFIAPPDRHSISFIEGLGASFVQDAPAHAAIFKMTAAQAAQTAEARGEAGVGWVGLYHPAYALSFYLAGRDEPFAAAELQTLRVDPAQVAPAPAGSVRLRFFPDQTPAQRRPAVEATGATVVTDTGYDLIVNVSAENIPALLRVRGIQALERYRPAGPANYRAGRVMAADQVRHLGVVDFLVNLDGTGEIVGVVDTGLDNGVIPTAHTDFNVPAGAGSRILLLTNLNPPPPLAPPNSSADFYPHGTHVAGSIAGDGRNAPAPSPANPNRSVPRGIAPRCQIIFHSVNDPASPPPSLNYALYRTAFQDAYDRGARVQSNSWTTPGHNSYIGPSGTIDRFAFLHPDVLILFAAGNDEADWNNDGTLDQTSLGEEAVSKNILCIGACENETNMDGDQANYRTTTLWNNPPCTRYGNAALNIPAGSAAAFSMSDSANHLALFSNRGRVIPGVLAQGRVRPDLVAPGTNIVSTKPIAYVFAPNVVPNCPPLAAVPSPWIATTAPGGFYYVSSGSSMATPLVAGAAALVRQFYRKRFGQLRRPLLIEALARRPAAGSLAFVDMPSAVAHQSGCVLAWVRPTVAGPNQVAAGRFNRQLVPIEAIAVLQVDVGAHPAITLARHNNNTLLAHRSNNSVRLSLYDDRLNPIRGFGANGVVNVADNSVTDDNRRPAICVRDNEVAVVWVQNANDALLFQRFNAATGQLNDAAPINIGACTNTSTHPHVVHNGTRYAAAWVRLSGGNYQLLMRFIENNGSPDPAQPITVITQAQPIREAHLVWDSRQNQYLVVWASEDAAGQHIFAVRVHADGTSNGIHAAVVTVGPGLMMRRPRVALHPDSGYTLLWEDNSEQSTVNGTTRNTHDLYLTFLDDNARPDRRVGSPDNLHPSFNRLQISDTPNDISGFSALVDDDGILPVWQSDDEINSDLRGIFALNVTRGGAFQAQVDSDTPLLQNGHYVPHLLLEHNAPAMKEMAMVWSGGDYYHLRVLANDPLEELMLVRTNADGKPDPAFGADGARLLDFSLGYTSVSLFWDNTLLLAASTDLMLGTRVFLCDVSGNSVATFGVDGGVTVSGSSVASISVQAARVVIGPNSRIVVVCGDSHRAGPHRIRYTAMTETGATTGADTVPLRNLVEQADGTAKQGWFHVSATDVPIHFIAAWHVTVGARQQVLLNRFQLDGNPQAAHPALITLSTAPAGDSQNAVIAPRPVLFNPQFPASLGSLPFTNTRQREYGAAWQYRPAAAAPWQIRFSRLNRDGTVQLPTADVQVFADGGFHGTEPQLVWHTDGYGIAWLRRPVAGGNRQLVFTVLDQNGARVDLRAFGAAAAAPVPDIPFSAAGADVQTFQLVWNGRTFRIAWTETLRGKLRHMQSAISVPRLQGDTRYDEPYSQPSSALVRATLINGATNIRDSALPNIGNDPNDGYGWGRINLRQSLAPAPPVTFHVRDDSAVARGLTARYEFHLPRDTKLLRITLAWTDPPDVDLVNTLNLRVTSLPHGATPSRTYVGNHWQPGPLVRDVSGPPFSDPVPAIAVNVFEGVHNVQQVVIPNPPAGRYLVEVMFGGPFRDSAFMQFPGQPFALVFVGSGAEARTGITPPAAPAAGPLPIY